MKNILNSVWGVFKENKVKIIIALVTIVFGFFEKTHKTEVLQDAIVKIVQVALESPEFQSPLKTANYQEEGDDLSERLAMAINGELSNIELNYLKNDIYNPKLSDALKLMIQYSSYNGNTYKETSEFPSIQTLIRMFKEEFPNE